jgi:hypothetical protein
LSIKKRLIKKQTTRGVSGIPPVSGYKPVSFHLNAAGRNIRLCLIELESAESKNSS